MIDFRYHLVSIVAVFMALAIGIVLGTGPLREPIRENLKANTETLRKSNDDLRAQLRTLQDQVDYDQRFASAVLPDLLGGRLQGATVLLVVAPGAADATVSGLGEAITTAGGRIAGTLTLTSTFIDPAQSGELGRLADRYRPAGVELAAQDSPAERAATVLASLLLTTADVGPGQQLAPEAQAALSGFEDGDLVKVKALQAVASMAVLVAPAQPPAESDAASRDAQVLLAVARRFDAASLGTVVAGTGADAGGTGLVAVLRQSDAAGRVSSVDTADTVIGQAAAVLALAEQRLGRAGQYGSGGGADQPAPAATPGATP